MCVLICGWTEASWTLGNEWIISFSWSRRLSSWHMGPFLENHPSPKSFCCLNPESPLYPLLVGCLPSGEAGNYRERAWIGKARSIPQCLVMQKGKDWKPLGLKRRDFTTHIPQGKRPLSQSPIPLAPCRSSSPLSDISSQAELITLINFPHH